jgi:hypothetical protein
MPPETPLKAAWKALLQGAGLPVISMPAARGEVVWSGASLLSWGYARREAWTAERGQRPAPLAVRSRAEGIDALLDLSAAIVGGIELQLGGEFVGHGGAANGPRAQLVVEGVRWTEAALLRWAQLRSEARGDPAETIRGCVQSLHGELGLVQDLLPALFARQIVLVPERDRPAIAQLLEWIVERGVTRVMLTPPQVEELIARAEACEALGRLHGLAVEVARGPLSPGLATEARLIFGPQALVSVAA